jgi:hypothetical protein
MSTTPRWFVPAVLTVGLGLSLDQPGNLTGTWHLNVEKSRWGEMRKPNSVVLVIDHKEPALHYSGSIMYANEDTREFVFDGAIDGKEYPMTRSFGKGKVALHRVGPSRFDSTFRTDDGVAVETAANTLSRDGRTLTRQLRLQTPEGTKSWTEIYERR